jgi:hypothetical protein
VPLPITSRMNTITNMLKRLMTANSNKTHSRPAVAAVVEPVEGRVLMSGSLLSTHGFCDGSVRPAESLSLNFTTITYSY